MCADGKGRLQARFGDDVLSQYAGEYHTASTNTL